VGVLAAVDNRFEQLILRVFVTFYLEKLFVTTERQYLRDLVSDLLAKQFHKMVLDTTGQQFAVHQHSLHLLLICLFLEILGTQNWGFDLNIAE